MTGTRTTEKNAHGEANGLPVAHHTDNTRLEAFSDAIFGFAATLLVVSLEVPKDFVALKTSLRGFVPFGLSFGMLAAIWSVHRGFFRRHPMGDTTTVVLNTVLMFLVLFYVYPLKFLTRMFVRGFFGTQFVDEAGITSVGELGQTFVIYGIGWAAVFGCIALMYWHAFRQGSVSRLPSDNTRTAADYAGHYLVFAAVGVLSAILATVGVGMRIGVPGFIYVITGPVVGLYWSWRKKRKTAAT